MNSPQLIKMRSIIAFGEPTWLLKLSILHFTWFLHFSLPFIVIKDLSYFFYYCFFFFTLIFTLKICYADKCNVHSLNNSIYHLMLKIPIYSRFKVSCCFPPFNAFSVIHIFICFSLPSSFSSIVTTSIYSFPFLVNFLVVDQ